MKPADRLTGNHRETSELLGISQQALWKAVKERGCPVLAPRKKGENETFYYWPAVVAWRLEDVSADPDELNLDRERARLAKAQADKCEIEVRELRGQLIRRQVVLDSWQAMIGSMRSKLLAVPTKSAAQIVEPSRLAEATAVVRAFVNEALAEIAGDGIPVNARRDTAPADSDGESAAARPGPDSTGEPDGKASAGAHGKRVGRSVSKPKPRGKRGAGKMAH